MATIAYDKRFVGYSSCRGYRREFATVYDTRILLSKKVKIFSGYPSDHCSEKCMRNSIVYRRVIVVHENANCIDSKVQKCGINDTKKINGVEDSMMIMTIFDAKTGNLHAGAWLPRICIEDEKSDEIPGQTRHTKVYI